MLLVVMGKEAAERDVLFGKGIGIGGKREEHRQAVCQAQSLALGESEGQVFEKGGLSRSRISQEDEAVVALQEIQDRLRLAELPADGVRFVLSGLPAGQAETLPGLTLGRLQAGLQGNVHLQQGEPDRYAVRDAEALEVQIAVALDEVGEVPLPNLDEVGGRGSAGALRLAVSPLLEIPQSRHHLGRQSVGIGVEKIDSRFLPDPLAETLQSLVELVRLAQAPRQREVLRGQEDEPGDSRGTGGLVFALREGGL